VPSGRIVQMPQEISLRMPCDSSVLNMIRPSLSSTGCSAPAMFRWPIFSMFVPSSFITNNCKAIAG
jgi:hypothetical protein